MKKSLNAGLSYFLNGNQKYLYYIDYICKIPNNELCWQTHFLHSLDVSDGTISINLPQAIGEKFRRSRLRIKFPMYLQYFVYLIYFLFYLRIIIINVQFKTIVLVCECVCVYMYAMYRIIFKL